MHILLPPPYEELEVVTTCGWLPAPTTIRSLQKTITTATKIKENTTKPTTAPATTPTAKSITNQIIVIPYKSTIIIVIFFKSKQSL